MKKPTNKELQAEARSLRRYVTEPRLLEWLWPRDHVRIMKFLRDYDRAWYLANHARILPPIPIKPYEDERYALERAGTSGVI
ncbi:hypothetical protein ACEPPZ_06040 [Paracoccus yeei]|uniref:hypothetical protein n=1 Tax=Paracoccus yeei TaxID=147645 RepID=UPI0028D6544C|nr:hypothetical protein [Paracoccus yeei]